jgi:hypothetical protein
VYLDLTCLLLKIKLTVVTGRTGSHFTACNYIAFRISRRSVYLSNHVALIVGSGTSHNNIRFIGRHYRPAYNDGIICDRQADHRGCIFVGGHFFNGQSGLGQHETEGDTLAYREVGRDFSSQVTHHRADIFRGDLHLDSFQEGVIGNCGYG